MAQPGLQKAIEAAGGQKPLADKIGTTQSNVWYWLERAKNGVPAEWVLKVADASGVPAHEIRPDIFSAPAERDAASVQPVGAAA